MKRDHLEPGMSDAGFGKGGPPDNSGRGAPNLESGHAEMPPNTPVRSPSTLGSQELDALREALARLPSVYRIALEMRNLSGRSFEELAEKLGRSTDEVRKIWLQALIRLNEEMRTSGSQQGTSTPHDPQ